MPADPITGQRKAWTLPQLACTCWRQQGGHHLTAGHQSARDSNTGLVPRTSQTPLKHHKQLGRWSLTRPVPQPCTHSNPSERRTSTRRPTSAVSIANCRWGGLKHNTPGGLAPPEAAPPGRGRACAWAPGRARSAASGEELSLPCSQQRCARKCNSRRPSQGSANGHVCAVEAGTFRAMTTRGSLAASGHSAKAAALQTCSTTVRGCCSCCGCGDGQSTHAVSLTPSALLPAPLLTLRARATPHDCASTGPRLECAQLMLIIGAERASSACSGHQQHPISCVATGEASAHEHTHPRAPAYWHRHCPAANQRGQAHLTAQDCWSSAHGVADRTEFTGCLAAPAFEAWSGFV